MSEFCGNLKSVGLAVSQGGVTISKPSIYLTLLVFLVFLEGSAAAQDQRVDDISAKLFETYIARKGKINTATIMAATHIVAERGRQTGFWKTVLQELKRGDPNSEVGCVRVLGKMLAIDASARDAHRRFQETGEVGAWAASVRLSPDVVTTLIERGSKSQRFRIDHYAIALARARVPESKGFFQVILRIPGATDPFSNVPRDPPPLDTTRFHAAVGLAQLGESEGIDWLVANCLGQGTVMNAWPVGARRGGGMGACCVEALRQLSDRQLTTKEEWTNWAQSVDKKSLLRRAVILGDP